MSEHVAMGVIGAVAVSTLLWGYPEEPSARGPILLDAGARRALRLSSSEARRNAAQLSDVAFDLMVAYPIAVDAGGVAWVHDGNDDVATQMLLIDAEAFAISGTINQVVKHFVARARPYTDTACTKHVPETAADADADYPRCAPDERYRSFVAGHTVVTFTSAALICAHHLHLPLYGGAADSIACAVGLGTATLTGLLRIASDNHYLSDVVAGAMVGLFAGYVVPSALHYGFALRKSESGTRSSSAPLVVGFGMPF